MKKWILLILSLLSILSFAEIYKWTDEKGNVHFSDKPVVGAEKVKLPESQTISSPPINIEEISSKNAPEAVSQVVEKYEIKILEPKAEDTIRNNEGLISVLLEVTPELKEDIKTQISIDGKALGKPQSSLMFSLKDVDRGAHTLVAELFDSEGNSIATSESITVYMQRPRVGMAPHVNKAN